MASSLLSLQYPTILSHPSASSSSQSSSHTCLGPKNIHSASATGNLEILRSHRNRIHSRRSDLVTRSAVEENSVTDSAAEAAAASAAAFGFGDGSKSELTASAKLKLLSVVSGLNRGLAASEDDLRKAEAAASELEAIGEPVNLSVDTDKLQGKWKLIYSSAFSSRTLGGSRPGPRTGSILPITLGQVFQRIDTVSKDFDNIVELELGAPWPFPNVELTATLAHKFQIIGTSKVKIVFEKTTVKPKGNLSQLPALDIPRIPDGFRPPSNTGSGEFEITYLDSDTRITRGDRSELRVFVIC